MVSGTLNGRHCEITVDTGSNISIVRPDILQNLGEEVIQPVTSCLKTVTGETAPIRGRCTLQLGLGTQVVPLEMWIADIHDQCILGLDFLQPYGCHVNLRDGALTLREEEIPLKKPSLATKALCCKAVLQEGVGLPPLSEAVVSVAIECPHDNSRWAVLEPLEQSAAGFPSDGLLIGRTLVDLHQKHIPLRLMNLSTEPRNIRKGTKVARCEAVSCVLPSSAEHTAVIGYVGAAEKTEQLPHHIRELYDRSVTHLSSDESRQVSQLLCEFSDVFSTGPHDLGCTDRVKHRINTGGAAPIRQPPRRLPLMKKQEAEKIVQDMQEQGVIEPSSSPWSSPVVLVRKKDGSSRFCVDYRKLNDVTHKDSYPLPRIDDTLEALAGSSLFSTLDLKSGYWQVQVEERDREKTAFSVGNGLWQFAVMPFGLCNAPATFERLMEQVLAGLPLQAALIYLDDILVTGKSFSNQLSNLRLVLQRLRGAKLKLSPKKCSLFQREVQFLGHIVSKDGVSPEPGKVESVTTWPTPVSGTETKRFLGLCSYYRRFVPSFADTAQPLYQAAESNPFTWTPEAEEAFKQLKLALTSSPILAYPDPDADFILDTDASNLGIGAVLSQIQDGVERVVAYFSQVLSRPERNYCVTRRELLAAVKAIRHFYPYLYGKKFLLRTDHSSLRWLLSFRHPEGQLARWLESLQQYDFSIEHRPGSKHANADALSRRPCLRENCRHCDRLECREHSEREKEQTPSGLPVPAPQGQPQSTHLNGTLSEASPTGPDVPVSLPQNPEGVPSVATARHSGLRLSGGWEPREVRLSQANDGDIRPIVEWLEKSRDRPRWEEVAPCSEATKAYWAQWQSLELHDGVLYRLWETPAGDASVKQLVVPKTLRPDVLHQLHNVPVAGHFGVAKTLGRLRERFYWPRCHRDVRDWCRSCDLCAQKRGPPRKRRSPLGQYNVGSPLERLAIDILGPLPETEEGNKYIAIVADYFTKWVEAYPLPNQEATTIAEALVRECICRFGVPLFLHSDQGRNFEATVFAETCRLMGIKKTRTTPYHPQSDGMVERFNRTLEAQLAKFVDYHQRDWDKHIPFLLMAYRSAVHDSTGCSPAKLMFGHDLRLPIDLEFGRPEVEPGPVTEFASALQDRIDSVHDFARTHLKLASDRMKRRYDSVLAGHPLEAGEAVWLHNPQRRKGLSPKLTRPWQGPYTIVKKINDLIYRIQLGPTTKPKVVHRDRLWKYEGANAPSWFQATASDPAGAIPPSKPSAEVENEHGSSEDGCRRGSHNSRAPPRPGTANENMPDSSQAQRRRSSRRRREPARYGTFTD